MPSQLTDEDLLGVPVSDKANGLLTELLEAAEEYAFLGAAHPQDQDGIIFRYDSAELAVRRLINRLEANQK